VAFTSADGHAHTGEYLRRLTLHPTNPQLFVLRYEAALGGLLFSRDGGKSLQIVPGQSFDMYPLQRRVPMLMTGDGKLQISLDSEVRTDDGTGCSLNTSEPALQGAWIADLASHPSDPNVSFVVTSAPASGKYAGLWRRDAQGVFTPIGAADIAGTALGEVPFRPTSLTVIARAASVDGLRFIEGGRAADSASPGMQHPVLRVSDDLGASWTTHEIPDPSASHGAPQVLVVSGSDPFRALVALEAGLGEDDDDPYDPIYLTKDSGQSFTPYSDQIQVSGEAVLLPSGQILLGDRGVLGGLWSAPNFDSAPTKIQDWRVHCLAYQQATQKIFLCMRHELGFYDATSNSFCAFFEMTDTNAFVSCPSAPLEQNAKATAQLCSGYCSAQHYAEARVCETFDVGKATLCGPAARAYDTDVGYIPPPGPTSFLRCSGFESAPPDAGVSADADAATPLFADADAGAIANEPERDASSEEQADEQDEDAGLDSVDDSESEDGAESDDAGAKKRKKKHKGCACDVSADDSPSAQSLPILVLALWLAFRLARPRRSARG
jgi:hypothetical protein